MLAVRCGNTSTLLPAMLQGKKSKICKASYIFIWGVNPKDTTSFVQIHIPKMFPVS
jgi:hypothetical protein